MRVKYGELRVAERRRLAALDARIDAVFAEAASEDRDSAWWSAALARVCSGLDAARSEDGTILLRVSSRELSPIAERVVARASADFHVLALRPREPLEQALAAARLEHSVDLRRARFRAGFGRGHLLELVLYVPGGSGSAHEHAAAERLVQGVLGERLAEDWIGAVRIAPEPRGGPLRVLHAADVSGRAPEPPRLALDALSETVDAAIRGVYEALPSEPAWAHRDESDWVLLELDPDLDPAGDWPAQDDLFLTATRQPELVRCFLSGAPFASARFSRHGERYFYLKFAAHGELEARLSARAKLEDAFDAALVGGRLGRVIGGGLGLGHTYVDVALIDCERAFALLRSVGQALEVPRASWILPFDDDIAAEWIEIWPDAPAPPGASL